MLFTIVFLLVLVSNVKTCVVFVRTNVAIILICKILSHFDKTRSQPAIIENKQLQDLIISILSHHLLTTKRIELHLGIAHPIIFGHYAFKMYSIAILYIYACSTIPMCPCQSVMPPWMVMRNFRKLKTLQHPPSALTKRDILLVQLMNLQKFPSDGIIFSISPQEKTHSLSKLKCYGLYCFLFAAMFDMLLTETGHQSPESQVFSVVFRS